MPLLFQAPQYRPQSLTRQRCPQLTRLLCPALHCILRDQQKPLGGIKATTSMHQLLLKM